MPRLKLSVAAKERSVMLGELAKAEKTILNIIERAPNWNELSSYKKKNISETVMHLVKVTHDMYSPPKKERVG